MKRYHGRELGTTSVPPTIRFLPMVVTDLGFILTISVPHVLTGPLHSTLTLQSSGRVYKMDRGLYFDKSHTFAWPTYTRTQKQNKYLPIFN